ncbi:MAG: DUF1573 domain-containing protein [Bacteroidales bacterium]|jgi:hypothetical protein|nr:DUF1573 domain-containing protein [Bacteroidales bacterium]MCR5550875.1 DUF1573 domain-containing protein [Bacteroidales bacterium]
MKKVFSLLIVMAFVFSAVAQDANADKPKKVKEPEITFENLVHDYGEIQQGANGTCEFVFKNTGKADLILTNCRSSCGCTVPEWPKDPIPPGKKAVIKVSYNTNRLGIINKSITVESNAVNNRVILNIKGNVSAKPAEAAPTNEGGAVKAQ